jgi:hypothetical protein
MQNAYACDVGDFGKYGLLRFLFPEGGMKLGVVWWLCADSVGKSDGKYVEYREKPEFAECDPSLHLALGSLIEKGDRSVAAVELSMCLGSRTVFYSEPLEFSGISAPAFTERGRNLRLEFRERWLDGALAATVKCDGVFVDPDNGIECKSASRHGREGVKFVFLDEINRFVERGQTVVIYHHLNRHKDHGSHLKQVEDRASQLLTGLSRAESVFGLRYSPYSPRAFFIVCPVGHRDDIAGRLGEFAVSKWNRFFDCFVRRERSPLGRG